MDFNLPLKQINLSGSLTRDGQHMPEWRMLMVGMPFWHIDHLKIPLLIYYLNAYHNLSIQVVNMAGMVVSLLRNGGQYHPEYTIELQNTINLLKKAGFEVKRFAINQTPLAFISNAVVKQFITTQGPQKLPITLFNGKIIKTEAYPSLNELAVHIPELNNIQPDEKILGIFS